MCVKKSEAMVVAFFQDLWQSIFEPGASPVVVKATHLSFAGLVLTLVTLFYVTRSYHFLVMLALSIGLWLSVAWFVSEYTKLLSEKKQNEKLGNENAGESEAGEKNAATAPEAASSSELPPKDSPIRR